MVIRLTTGFDKKNRCEEYTDVTLTATEAKEYIQSVFAGASYKTASVFASKYKSKPVPIVPSKYIIKHKRKPCSTRR